jgi:hypothetical protein
VSVTKSSSTSSSGVAGVLSLLSARSGRTVRSVRTLTALLLPAGALRQSWVDAWCYERLRLSPSVRWFPLRSGGRLRRGACCCCVTPPARLGLRPTTRIVCVVSDGNPPRLATREGKADSVKEKPCAACWGVHGAVCLFPRRFRSSLPVWRLQRRPVIRRNERPARPACQC